MSIQEASDKVKAQVWQAIAHGDVDASGIEKEKLTALVDYVTQVALLVADEEMGAEWLEEAKRGETAVSPDLLNDDKEDILWEGRPFFSLNHHYTITDERIRITVGFLGKARDNIELVRIQDLNYKQNVSERMFNIGDIFIHSNDRSNPNVTLRNVKDPEQVYEILRRAVLAARRRHGFTYREEM
jgi:hypothetical protein